MSVIDIEGYVPYVECHPVPGNLARGGAGNVPTPATAAGRFRDDTGALTVFALLMTVGLVALVGLVVDGGSALTARQAAAVEAEQAARSGAGALDVGALRLGVVQIDPTAAVAAAQQFAMATGHPATASVYGGVVTVHVHYHVATAILGMVGIRSLGVSATASAENLHGVTVGVP